MGARTEASPPQLHLGTNLGAGPPSAHLHHLALATLVASHDVGEAHGRADNNFVGGLLDDKRLREGMNLLPRRHLGELAAHADTIAHSVSGPAD
jgi:hypothetical protein